MKTITIDLKSFCFGALAVGTVLLMANKPASQPATQPQPYPDNRRFQVMTGEKETVILDTQTGEFILNPAYIGRPRWISGKFEEIKQNK